MGSFTCAASCHSIWCSAGKDGPDLNKQKLTNVKINGNISRSWAESSEALSQVSRVATLSSVAQNGYIAEQQVRQNIPTKKQFMDTHRQGVIIEGGVGYRQTVVIRSYEVGPDKTATVESILNLFQVMVSVASPRHIFKRDLFLWRNYSLNYPGFLRFVQSNLTSFMENMTALG